MNKEQIREKLFALQDIKYRDFQIKLIPGKTPDNMIGVRTPELRKLAKEIGKDMKEDPEASAFLMDLPHEYFEEDQLHAFILSDIREYDRCLADVSSFLPYVDNWATCDQMSPKVFKKHRSELLPEIDRWIASGDTYAVRFGVKMLMEHFLDEDFGKGSYEGEPGGNEYIDRVVGIESEEYYVNMMRAWYFATALAKQWDAAAPYIENRRLDRWAHNKAIQKAVESYRITPEQKDYLRSLRLK